MLPVWGYLVVAFLIALFAFAIGQAMPGMGAMFAALASTLWVAYAVHRGRRHVGRQ